MTPQLNCVGRGCLGFQGHYAGSVAITSPTSLGSGLAGTCCSPQPFPKCYRLASRTCVFQVASSRGRVSLSVYNLGASAQRGRDWEALLTPQTLSPELDLILLLVGTRLLPLWSQMGLFLLPLLATGVPGQNVLPHRQHCHPHHPPCCRAHTFQIHCLVLFHPCRVCKGRKASHPLVEGGD